VTVADWFHVTSSRNRESILRRGLDWRYMSEASGIAGSAEPEQQGCFLCRGDSDVDFFVGMNNTGGPVDVWAVAGVHEELLVQSSEGFDFIPAPIPPDRLTLVRANIEPVDHNAPGAEVDGPSGTITIKFRPGHGRKE
jgi:hypothetical protein